LTDVTWRIAMAPPASGTLAITFCHQTRIFLPLYFAGASTKRSTVPSPLAMKNDCSTPLTSRITK